MKTEDIRTLLQMKESDTFDFKSEQYKFYNASKDDKSELLKDILAFANTWKTSDAYIVIGVSEKDGRMDGLVGVKEHLQDSDIQQFVISHTNRKVDFLVYSETVDGFQLDVIQIFKNQLRPVFLPKGFGKLKSNEVRTRLGSSTPTIENIDEIVKMALVDRERDVSRVILDLDLIEDPVGKRVGEKVSIYSVKIDFPVIELELGSSSDPFDFAGRALTRQPTDEEITTYIKLRGLLQSFKIWIRNSGDRNVSSVNVVIPIPKLDGVSIMAGADFPETPRNRPLHTLLSADYNTLDDVYVDELEDSWSVQVKIGTIQPKAECASIGCFYIGSEKEQVIQTIAKIFADNLAEPIEIPLEFKIETSSREVTGEDVSFLFEES